MPGSDVTIDKEQALVAGKFFESASARNHDATLRVARNEVFVKANDNNQLLMRANRDDIQISDKLAAVARRISFADGTVFVTHDNSGVDRMLGITSSDASVNWLEQFRLRLIIIVVLAVLAFAGVFRYGLPVAVSAAIAITPNALVKQLSQSSFDSFHRTSLLNPTKVAEDRRERLQQEFRILVENSSDRVRQLEPTLHFRASPIGPNALALPDGTIVVTDALTKLVKDDAIVSILGHELGHVHHQHSLQLIYRSAGFAALIALVAGDVGGVLEEVLLQGAGVLALSYNRQFEHEADTYSVDLMKRTGRDPKALLNFFQVLESKFPTQPGKASWFSTHPSSSERIDAIRKQTQ